MKTLSLQITKPGYKIDIPGVSSMRSPCTVDISNVDIATVLHVLRRNGINDFKIISRPISKNRSLDIQISPDDNREILLEQTVPVNNNEELLNNLKSKIDEINSRTYIKLDDIDTKLDYIMDHISSGSEVVKKQSKQEDVDDSDQFIPRINIDGMSISKDSSESVIVEEFQDAVKSLKGIYNK
jgi:hypothetical protein